MACALELELKSLPRAVDLWPSIIAMEYHLHTPISIKTLLIYSKFKSSHSGGMCGDGNSMAIIIDLEAREIMYLVASFRQSALSRLNRFTYDLDIWYVG